ncbi:alpha-ketoglutarate-dependent dioxygenase AlkB family protein [Galactobacter caseinivorans]|uniref:Alpha-ketoglutarate-dependent dioxygenase AlkB n=1 Tax=Galactobacter caseinivorans TaxID=2676123 RepID=A0A496PIY2_9MICC|nr:alpha-ketoglutarate-dependent dioxygenase AlkB [Galactobacter caseinivorans]RKW70456.1 alpha-ketoglutarate-dependent dioxygenase AlkB [Galactobacter caseinivorans]
MDALFSEDAIPRERRELAPGAVWLPGFLDLAQQRWLVERFREWAAGPVPPRAASYGEHQMSVKTVCLGWHWRPGGYSREAVDVNGHRVLGVPDWMVRLGRRAISAAYGVEPGAAPGAGPSPWVSGDYTPDTALANFYDASAHMGMHQDADELAPDPVVSLSLGDSCLFRFGNTDTRGRPYQDIRLASGDLFVFGGPARRAFHGVQKILPSTAPEGCGLTSGRINITLRNTGLSGPGSGGPGVSGTGPV